LILYSGGINTILYWYRLFCLIKCISIEMWVSTDYLFNASNAMHYFTMFIQLWINIGISSVHFYFIQPTARMQAARQLVFRFWNIYLHIPNIYTLYLYVVFTDLFWKFYSIIIKLPFWGILVFLKSSFIFS